MCSVNFHRMCTMWTVCTGYEGQTRTPWDLPSVNSTVRQNGQLYRGGSGRWAHAMHFRQAQACRGSKPACGMPYPKLTEPRTTSQPKHHRNVPVSTMPTPGHPELCNHMSHWVQSLGASKPTNWVSLESRETTLTAGPQGTVSTCTQASLPVLPLHLTS